MIKYHLTFSSCPFPSNLLPLFICIFSFTNLLNLSTNLFDSCMETDAGADVVMLDNFSPDELRDASKHLKAKAPYVLIEGSGGITLETIQSFMHPRTLYQHHQFQPMIVSLSFSVVFAVSLFAFASSCDYFHKIHNQSFDNISQMLMSSAHLGCTKAHLMSTSPSKSSTEYSYCCYMSNVSQA